VSGTATNVKSYYELLDVPPDAPADEIKRAFRREIAKYHPDKVQHLGTEFQEIAASKAAELTLAYKALSNPGSRAEYDAALAEGGHRIANPAAASAPAPRPSEPRPAGPRHPLEPAVPRSADLDRDRRSVDDLMLRATMLRFQAAVKREFGSYDELRLPGFELGAVPAAKFWTLRVPPRVLGKFVPVVDAKAVAEAWLLAAKMKKDGQRDVCIFLMGPALASAAELALAIAEQRKKPTPPAGKFVLIPVNTKDWSAHVPTDAPDVCKSILGRLKSNS
jgi:hypothetical protein